MCLCAPQLMRTRERERVRERTGALSWADKQVVVCCLYVFVFVFWHMYAKHTERRSLSSLLPSLTLGERKPVTVCKCACDCDAFKSAQHEKKLTAATTTTMSDIFGAALLSFVTFFACAYVCVWWQSVSRRQLSEFCCCCVSIEISFDMFGCTRSRRNPS